MDSAIFSDLALIFVGVPFTFIMWALMSLLIVRNHQRTSVYLNQNLNLIGLKWSYEKDDIVDVSTTEKVRSFGQLMILGSMVSILSWLGFLMSIVIWGSLLFVRSRREKFIMNSGLCLQGYQSIEMIRETVSEFKRLFPDDLNERSCE